MIPNFIVLTPKEWEGGSSRLLMDLLFKRGIKAALPPAGSLPAKQSNFNIIIHLGDKKQFIHREDKYDQFNIHIGYEQTTAWIYVSSEHFNYLDDFTISGFISLYNELVTSDPLKGILEEISEYNINMETPGWREDWEFIKKWNPGILYWALLYNIILTCCRIKLCI